MISTYQTYGINPANKKPVNVTYGYQRVDGYNPGYYISATDPKAINQTFDGKVLERGTINGIAMKELQSIAMEWKVFLEPIETT